MNYPANWHEIADSIKQHAHWRCQNCNHPHDPSAGYTLTVHHLDNNPANSHPFNLVALYQRCHLHYQQPLNLFQLSFWGLPKWLQDYHNRLQPHNLISPWRIDPIIRGLNPWEKTIPLSCL